MISIMAVEEALEKSKVGSMIKVYADDFAMCAYIRYLGKQEEYELIDVVEGDDKHMPLFILQKIKNSI